MPAYMDVSDANAAAMLDAMVSLNNGTCELRTGAPPGIGNADAGTLLATLTFGATAFASTSSRQRLANAIATVVAIGSGVLGHARFKTSGAVKTFDLKAGGSFICTFPGANLITANAAHGYTAGDAVQFFTAGTLPTGISANTTYYVIASGLTATDFKVSATSGGGAITITGSGSGTIRVKRDDVGVAIASSDGSIAPGVDVSVVSMALRFPLVF